MRADGRQRRRLSDGTCVRVVGTGSRGAAAAAAGAEVGAAEAAGLMDPRQYSLAAEIRELPDKQTDSDAADRGAEYHHARGFTHRKNNDYAAAVAEVGLDFSA